MTSRTHAGALCQQEHLTHRTLLEARRCDAETAEARALHLYEIHRQGGGPSRRSKAGMTAIRPFTLAIAIVRRLIRPDA